MTSEQRKANLKKLISNKFVLGLIAGFTIGLVTNDLIVGIALIAVIGLAWYSASRKKEEVEEEV